MSYLAFFMHQVWLKSPGRDDLQLLYVGISGNLRARLLRKHLGLNAGGSTLRRTLAALVGEPLELRTCWSPNGDRVTLERASELRLSEWMRKTLYVTWTSQPDPKSVEAATVRLLQPPCNIDHNTGHPNHVRMVEARRTWRASLLPS